MKRGDVILVCLPFVGASGVKLRPALVVQEDGLNTAVRVTIIAEITSNVTHTHLSHQVLIDISTVDGSSSGLIMNSAIRCNRLHVIPQSDVQRVLGSLTPAIMSQVELALKAALGIS